MAVLPAAALPLGGLRLGRELRPNMGLTRRQRRRAPQCQLDPQNHVLHDVGSCGRSRAQALVAKGHARPRQLARPAEPPHPARTHSVLDQHCQPRNPADGCRVRRRLDHVVRLDRSASSGSLHNELPHGFWCRSTISIDQHNDLRRVGRQLLHAKHDRKALPAGIGIVALDNRCSRSPPNVGRRVAAIVGNDQDFPAAIQPRLYGLHQAPNGFSNP